MKSTQKPSPKPETVSNQKSGAKIPTWFKFFNSGLSGCIAVLFVHPIDVVKNRMQLSGEGGKAREHKTSFHAFKNIFQREGPSALYDGFTANVSRQIVYTTLRIGLFQAVSEYLAEQGLTELKGQVTGAAIAGAVSSFIATPLDVCLVRMTADRRLPKSEQRNYKNVFDALNRIRKEEGLNGLWTGAYPTVVRAAAGTICQMVPYVRLKHYLMEKGYAGDSFLNHLTSSLLAGISYAFLTTPLDVAKTRIQTMKTIDGVPEYKGILDVWAKTVKKEGVTALWKGFGPYYFRIAPFTMVMILSMEEINRLYKVYVLDDPDAKGGL